MLCLQAQSAARQRLGAKSSREKRAEIAQLITLELVLSVAGMLCRDFTCYLAGSLAAVGSTRLPCCVSGALIFILRLLALSGLSRGVFSASGWDVLTSSVPVRLVPRSDLGRLLGVRGRARSGTRGAGAGGWRVELRRAPRLSHLPCPAICGHLLPFLHLPISKNNFYFLISFSV